MISNSSTRLDTVYGRLHFSFHDLMIMANSDDDNEDDDDDDHGDEDGDD